MASTRWVPHRRTELRVLEGGREETQEARTSPCGTAARAGAGWLTSCRAGLGCQDPNAHGCRVPQPWLCSSSAGRRHGAGAPAEGPAGVHAACSLRPPLAEPRKLTLSSLPRAMVPSRGRHPHDLSTLKRHLPAPLPGGEDFNTGIWGPPTFSPKHGAVWLLAKNLSGTGQDTPQPAGAPRAGGRVGRASEGFGASLWCREQQRWRRGGRRDPTQPSATSHARRPCPWRPQSTGQ